MQIKGWYYSYKKNRHFGIFIKQSLMTPAQRDITKDVVILKINATGNMR